MLPQKSSQIAASLIIASSLILGLTTVSQAQSNPGFSFIRRGEQPAATEAVNYRVRYGQVGARRDTYQLLMRPQAQPISSITITFPDYYDGKYKASHIQLIAFSQRSKKVIPLKAIKITKEQRQVQIIPETPIPLKANLLLQFNNVTNPSKAGIYPLTATITSPGDIPLKSATTTWPLRFTK